MEQEEECGGGVFDCRDPFSTHHEFIKRNTLRTPNSGCTVFTSTQTGWHRKPSESRHTMCEHEDQTQLYNDVFGEYQHCEDCDTYLEDGQAL
ncbi:hypothetical protein GS534_00885 [Rhodococcus hoagii]|nr:hypothetical protein [Prescottella equi]